MIYLHCYRRKGKNHSLQRGKWQSQYGTILQRSILLDAGTANLAEVDSIIAR